MCHTSLLRCFLVAATSVCLAEGSSAAANICNETVPTTRQVDGIPAYDQCSVTANSEIWSNNGVDTATATGGTGWVRTQRSGGYQCTELAHRYLLFKWGVQNVPNGNAGVWCDGTIPTGLVKTATPVHGDIIVFAPGSCGADTTYGHVAVVDVVGASSITFVEQNSAGRRSCATSTAACFLHATANGGVADGGAPDGGAPDGAAPDGSIDGGAGGASGSGGKSGSGGSGGLAAGGASGSGGLAAGGAPGSGGASGVDAGSGPQSGDGCGCGVGGGATPSVLSLMLLALATIRRRR